MNKCLYCGKDVKNKYCNFSCQGKHYNNFTDGKILLKRCGPIIEKSFTCELCGKIVKYLEREKVKGRRTRFCSQKCACTHTARTTNTKERNLKISNSLKARSKEKITIYYCDKCGKLLGNKKNASGLCKKCYYKSDKCYSKSDKGRQKSRETIYKSIKEGKIKWPSRNKKSYPEKFFTEVLKNNGLINYDFNHPVEVIKPGNDKKTYYFLDFYFSEKNIDLEIDGGMHKWRDRKEADIIRDKILASMGYKVYRIKWKSINTESGKKYIKEEIDKFLEFYNKP